MPLTCTSMLTTLCRYYLLRCDCDPNVKGLKEFNKDLKIAVLRSNLYKGTNFPNVCTLVTTMTVVHGVDHLHDSDNSLALLCHQSPPHIWPLAIIMKLSVSIVITFLGFHTNRMVQLIFFCLISFTYHLSFAIQLFCCLFQ